jgi:hypothetical protein
MQLHSGEIWILIPLVSIILGVGMTIVTILSRHRRQMQELDYRHRERMAAIEKGLDLPPDPVLVEQAAAVQRQNGLRRSPGSRHLLRGLVWLGIGLALVLSKDLLGDRTYGWIAVAVGIAYLVYYALEGRQEGPPPGSGGSPLT